MYIYVYIKYISIKYICICAGEFKFALAAHSSGITSLSISEQGILVTGSADADLRVWDLQLPWQPEMGTLLSCCEGAHAGAVTSCRLSEDGNALVSASVDGNLVIWDALKGVPLKYLIGHTGPVTSFFLIQRQAALNRSNAGVTTRSDRITGRLQYIVSASQDGTVRVWDVSSGLDQCFLRLPAPLTCMSKSQDESTIAVGDRCGNLHLLALRLPKK
jgi:WD40 repeat protein